MIYFQPPSSAVSPVEQQMAPESTEAHADDPDSRIQSLFLVSETIAPGSWGSGGVFNLEETPSEESDALREAYRSLGFGQDLGSLQEQCDQLEATLLHTQEQLRLMSKENAELQIELKEREEHRGEAGQKVRLSRWSSLIL